MEQQQIEDAAVEHWMAALDGWCDLFTNFTTIGGVTDPTRAMLYVMATARQVGNEQPGGLVAS